MLDTTNNNSRQSVWFDDLDVAAAPTDENVSATLPDPVVDRGGSGADEPLDSGHQEPLSSAVDQGQAPSMAARNSDGDTAEVLGDDRGHQPGSADQPRQHRPHVVGDGARRPHARILGDRVADLVRSATRWVSIHRGGVAVAGAALLVVAGVLAAVIGVLSSLDDDAPRPALPAAADRATGWCVDGVDGAGDTTTGRGVIEAFQYRYYVDRDASSALQLTTPQAGLSAQALEQAIGGVAAGVTHCVRITDTTTPNVYRVVVAERSAAGVIRAWAPQLVSVANVAAANADPQWRITDTRPAGTTTTTSAPAMTTTTERAVR